ncbi:hypothetical protein [Mycobacterium szulgai]|nr:hypothetical protein [Mycobacterium szulgai]
MRRKRFAAALGAGAGINEFLTAKADFAGSDSPLNLVSGPAEAIS